MEPPRIYDYNDFRKFLRDWWQHEFAEDPTLTKSEVSRRLGLPKTRSYFSDVLAGKKVTDLFLERFSTVLDLPLEQNRYFQALVRFNQADFPEEREAALERLVALDRAPFRQLGSSEMRYYEAWWNGALRAVLAIEDHGSDWERLANRLRPAITPRQAEESVSLMHAMGLLEQRADGIWKPTSSTLSSGRDAKGDAVVRMQREQFLLAADSVCNRPSGKSDFATSTIHISRMGLETLRDRINKFRSEIRSLCHRDPDPADRVYALCLAFFPLTQDKEP